MNISIIVHVHAQVNWFLVFFRTLPAAPLSLSFSVKEEISGHWTARLCKRGREQTYLHHLELCGWIWWLGRYIPWLLCGWHCRYCWKYCQWYLNFHVQTLKSLINQFRHLDTNFALFSWRLVYIYFWDWQNFVILHRHLHMQCVFTYSHRHADDYITYK